MARTTGLFKAAHFGPTLLVTSISIFLSLFYHTVSNSLLIGLTIFLGQLIVGWSNDLKDFEDDNRHGRFNKPLVANQISKKLLAIALFIDIPFFIFLNFFGPFGKTGGLISLIGVGVALTYNFYFKFNLFSPLPYALAFGALPVAILTSAGEKIKNWMWISGALLGIAAHFINVLKDLESDKTSGIYGLPQRVGRKNSIQIAVIFILAGLASAFSGLL
jgi:4-hydroxybenzoate polyprenyltransferase